MKLQNHIPLLYMILAGLKFEKRGRHGAPEIVFRCHSASRISCIYDYKFDITGNYISTNRLGTCVWEASLVYSRSVVLNLNIKRDIQGHLCQRWGSVMRYILESQLFWQLCICLTSTTAKNVDVQQIAELWSLILKSMQLLQWSSYFDAFGKLQASISISVLTTTPSADCTRPDKTFTKTNFGPALRNDLGIELHTTPTLRLVSKPGLGYKLICIYENGCNETGLNTCYERWWLDQSSISFSRIRGIDLNEQHTFFRCLLLRHWYFCL